MKDIDISTEIQNMSLGEKITVLDPLDKAFIKGFVERAILDSRKNKRKSKGKKTPEQKGND